MSVVVKHASVTVLSKAVGNNTRFPVNRIYCIGRNYREHAIEMGHSDRDPPFFFQKPADAVVDIASSQATCVIPYPPMTSALHHEAELVIAIGKEGLRITPENALSHVFGYAIGCDLTRRDLQSKAKKLAQPWATAKGFDYSAPCGPIVPADEVQLSANAAISLSINGRMRQDSTINKMIWSIPEIISILSKYFKLKPGDLIFTGTPEGVAAIVKGDVVRVECSNLPPCVFEVGEEE